jgi:glycosyltransferase involved in cell wall biosynthesis
MAVLMGSIQVILILYYFLMRKTGLKIKVELRLMISFLFFVGRLVGDKGINELIAAFRKFSGPAKVKLWLVRSKRN